MESKEEIINGETYMLTTTDSGHVIKELLRPPLAPAKRKTLAYWEFRALFSFDQQVAIAAAEKTDPIVATFVENARVYPNINLDHALVAQGLDYFVKQGLASEDDKTRILAGI